MAQGFAPALLTHLKTLMAQNYGGIKITPAGFLKALIDNNPNLDVSTIDGERLRGLKLSTDGGHIRDVRVKYLPRITYDQVSERDDCENDVGFSYSESSIYAPRFAKLGFQLEWNLVERYEKAASDLVNMGTPDVGVLREVETQLMHCVNGIISRINGTLLSDLTFGVNATTGTNATKLININRDGSVLNLSDGVTEILSDAQQNEFVGDVILVGNGTMNKFEIAKGSIAINSAGLNLGSQTGYSWYHDINSANVPTMGADAVAAFAKGSVGFVDIDRYISWKSGPFGNSYFAQILLPVESGEGVVTTMPFNLQVRELDCPAEAYDGYDTRTMGRGYQVLISKAYGLWQSPSNQFQPTDRLAGNNGSLIYKVTNNCDPCDSIVPPFADVV